MRIETFVFFDLEATGLPDEERNQTKITELTCLAVSRKDIIAAKVGEIPPMRKLTFLVNPQRKLRPNAMLMTGLTEEILSTHPVFKDKIDCINEFLDLPKPVCLVAHCGCKFDFPLLKTEYKEAGVSLPDDLYYIDSMGGFKYALKQISLFANGLSLKNLYKVLVKKEMKGIHRAEADCLMLLECVIATKTHFIKFSDVMCKNFKNMKVFR